MIPWNRAAKRAVVSIAGAFVSHALVDIVVPHRPPIGMILWFARTFILAAGFLLALTVLYHWMNGDVES